MDPKTLRKIMGEFLKIKRAMVEHRRGEITGLAPLQVTLGGASVPFEDVRSITGGLQVGDQVSALTFGNDMIVLGRLAPRVFEVSAASTVDLGAFDGENITGVRISLFGVVAGGTDTTLRLRPNGLSPVSANSVAELVYSGGSSHATVSTLLNGGAVGSVAGVPIAHTHWSVAGTVLAANGTFYTPKLGGSVCRIWEGAYTSRDATTDASNIANGVVSAQWNDVSTSITSLALALDAGTFTGRVSVEVVP